jgi:hypothetical protein
MNSVARVRNLFCTNVGIGLLGFFACSAVWSFSCHFTLVKASCWKKYTVTVDVVDVQSAKVLTTVTLPAGKEWVRQEFHCQPSQQLRYYAQFSPIIWDNDKGKKYSTLNYLSLPAAIKSSEKAWVISSCFPFDYANVPTPTDATAQCACDLSSIPAMQPQ